MDYSILEDEEKLPTWVTAIDNFLNLGRGASRKPPNIQSTLLLSGLDGFVYQKEAAQLWTDTSQLVDGFPSALLMLNGASGNAEKLIRRLKKAPGRRDAVTRGAMLPLRKTKIAMDFANLGPIGKMGKLTGPNVPHLVLNRFFRTSILSGEGARGKPTLL